MSFSIQRRISLWWYSYHRDQFLSAVLVWSNPTSSNLPPAQCEWLSELMSLFPRSLSSSQCSDTTTTGPVAVGVDGLDAARYDHLFDVHVGIPSSHHLPAHPFPVTSSAARPAQLSLAARTGHMAKESTGALRRARCTGKPYDRRRHAVRARVPTPRCPSSRH